MASKHDKEENTDEKQEKRPKKPHTRQSVDKENSKPDQDKLEQLTKQEMAKKADQIAKLAKQKSEEVTKILNPLKENINTSNTSTPVSAPRVVSSVAGPRATATITQGIPDVHYPYKSPNSSQNNSMLNQSNTIDMVPHYLQNSFGVSPIRPQPGVQPLYGNNFMPQPFQYPQMPMQQPMMQYVPQMSPQTQYVPVQQVPGQQVVPQQVPGQQVVPQQVPGQQVVPQRVVQSVQKKQVRAQYVDYDDPSNEVIEIDEDEPSIAVPFGDYQHRDDPDLEWLDDDEWLAQNMNDEGESVEISENETEGEVNIDLSTEDVKLSDDDRLGTDDAFDEAYMNKELIVVSKEVGAPIRQTIKKVAGKMWDRGIKKPKELDIPEAFKVLYRPSNADELVVPEFNELLKQLIPKKKRDRDRLSMSIHNAVLKGANGVLQAWNQLFDKKFSGKTDIVKILMKTMKALSYANGRLHELRRAQMKPFLPFKYWAICDEVEHPCHEWVFGSRFEEAIEKRDRVCKMVSHVNSGFGRGRGGGSGPQRHGRGGRGRGFQPYGRFTQRGGLHYDSWGNAFGELQDLLQSYPVQNISNTFHISNVNSPDQIRYMSLPYYVHPGEIGLNPNTSFHCSESECWVQKTTVQELPEQERWQGQPRPEQEGQLNASLSTDPHTMVGDTAYLSEIFIREEFLVGGLAQCYDRWAQLTSDPEILQYVRGVKLDFVETPVQDKLPHEIKFSKEEHTMVKKEIKKFLDLGILKKSKLQPGDYVSNLFARPKKEPGRLRLIANLKSLNTWVKFVHFKMDGIEDVINLMKPGMYMVSIDFTSSFYSINVDPQYRRYLKVICLGQIYEYQALPMGYSRSPLIFCKLLKVPLAYLRETFGYTNSAFVDDVWMGEDTIPEIEQNAKDSLILFQDLGYTANIPKSALGPAQIKPHLGLILNSLEMTVSLTEEKIKKFIDHAEKILNSEVQVIRTVASLIGQMNAARYAVRYGPLHTKSLEIAKNNALVQSKGDFEKEMRLSRLDKMDIKWWVDNLPISKKFVGYLPIDEVIHTDASTDGWGMWHEKSATKTGGRWSESEKQSHINVKEIWAILLGIQCMFDHKQGLHMHIFCDSQVAIACVNKQGSTHSLPCNSATRKLLLYCEKHEFVLTLTYLPSVENVQADEASRRFKNIDTEWMLNKDIFAECCKILQFQPEIDLFADRLNHQVPRYCSWDPDPQAEFIDALSIDWTGFNNVYAFMPFSLTGKVLKKLTECPTKLHMMIVAPYWTTQTWYPKLVNNLIKSPIIIKTHANTLVLPHDPKRVHPLTKKLKLMVGIISSDPWNAKVFQSQWQRPCVIPGLTTHTSNMPHILRDGKHIVVKGKYIPVIQM